MVAENALKKTMNMAKSVSENFQFFNWAKQKQYRNLGFEDHCSVKKRRNEIRG
jgi:hypothetical protein